MVCARSLEQWLNLHLRVPVISWGHVVYKMLNSVFLIQALQLEPCISNYQVLKAGLID